MLQREKVEAGQSPKGPKVNLFEETKTRYVSNKKGEGAGDKKGLSSGAEGEAGGGEEERMRRKQNVQKCTPQQQTMRTNGNQTTSRECLMLEGNYYAIGSTSCPKCLKTTNWNENRNETAENALS